MPVDIRNVVFSCEEMQGALVNYALRKSIRMPNATIERASVTTDQELKVRLHFAPIEINKVGAIVSFTYAQVATALVMYCLQHHEPLPRTAQKSVIPFEDGIALCLRFPWGDTLNPRHPALNPQVRAVLYSVPIPEETTGALRSTQ